MSRRVLCLLALCGLAACRPLNATEGVTEGAPQAREAGFAGWLPPEGARASTQARGSNTQLPGCRRDLSTVRVSTLPCLTWTSWYEQPVARGLLQEHCASLLPARPAWHHTRLCACHRPTSSERHSPHLLQWPGSVNITQNFKVGLHAAALPASCAWRKLHGGAASSNYRKPHCQHAWCQHAPSP